MGKHFGNQLALKCHTIRLTKFSLIDLYLSSFPGGKKDPEDESLVETAIREMEEELGIEKSHVQVWASMPPVPEKVKFYALLICNFCCYLLL